MPAVAPYIPPKDAHLANWADNFRTLILASPATYGLTPADAANIDGVVTPFMDSYGMVTSPTTKTPNAVAAKNTAKVNMLALVRPYAQQIALNAGVSSANKIALGLNPRTSTPSPVTPPVSGPVLSVQSTGNLTMILRYVDPVGSPSVKSKPFGVQHLRAMYAISATPITDPTLLNVVVQATKSPFTVVFGAPAGGKQVYFAAQWVTRKGDTSPWSPIINFTVPQAI